MSLPLKIALRYLLAPKSHAAINAITVVASCGVAIITAALICVLSVFNGFEQLVSRLTSRIDPDIRIEASVGRTFTDTPELRALVEGVDGVDGLCATLEETVLLSYGNHQLPAKIKGVEDSYNAITGIDSIFYGDKFLLHDNIVQYTVIGGGLGASLGIAGGFVRPITVYCPKRIGKIDITRPDDAFTHGELFCSGAFVVEQAEYDDEMMIAGIDFVRSLLQDSLATTAYELRLNKGTQAGKVKTELMRRLPDSYQVLTRQELQADSYRIVRIEKWITFLIIIFILMIASFNIIGALSMLIIDKEAEIDTLRNLGADHRLIARIFTIEGWLISGSGAIIGMVIGITLCLLQEHFGFIKLGGDSGNYIIESYPVFVQWPDILWSLLCIAGIGLFATLYPIRVLRRQGREA